MRKSFTTYSKQKIREIHALSAKYNGKHADHSVKLLELAEKHAKEIKDLYTSKDKHFTTEVGDLVILCLELLIEHQKEPDKIMQVCYSRYEKKLNELLNQ